MAINTKHSSLEKIDNNNSLMTNLQVTDLRGVDEKAANNIKIILTDNGFRVTNNGNEYIDASELRTTGIICMNKSRVKEVGEDNIYKIFHAFMW